MPDSRRVSEGELLKDSLYDQLAKFSDLAAAVTVAQLLSCLFLSFVLSVIVAKVYQLSFRGASYSPSFMQTLVISGMVVGVIMLIIGSNIARAFTLVGALSIVRYRNAVKDPRDVAFIFLVMAVGMACGTGFYVIAVTFTSVVSAAVLLLSYLNFGERADEERVVRIEAPAGNDLEGKFDDIFRAHTRGFSLLSMARTRMGTEMELTFAITVNRGFKAQKLIDTLGQVNNQLRVEIAGTSHMIDL